MTLKRWHPLVVPLLPRRRKMTDTVIDMRELFLSKGQVQLSDFQLLLRTKVQLEDRIRELEKNQCTCGDCPCVTKTRSERTRLLG